MRKKKTATSRQANVTTSDKIQVQNYEIPVAELAGWIQNNPKATASMLATLGVNLAQRIVVLGVMTGQGFDVKTKTEINVSFGTDNYFGDVATGESFAFFRGTSTLFTQQTGSSFTFGDLQTVIRAISTIKGAHGKPVPDIYFATPQMTQGRQLVQYVMLPSGEIIFLNPPGKPGITNIKYVPDNQTLLGVKTNVYGQGAAIVVMPFSKLRLNPNTIRDPREWNSTMSPPKGYVIQSLGRPKINDRAKVVLTVQLMATQTGQIFERTAILTKKGRGFTCEWGKQIEQIAPRIPIGTVSGYHDLFASLLPKGERSAQLIVEPSTHANSAVQEYLN